MKAADLRGCGLTRYGPSDVIADMVVGYIDGTVTKIAFIVLCLGSNQGIHEANIVVETYRSTW